MWTTLRQPSPCDYRLWGATAYLIKEDREKLCSLPCGEFRQRLKILNREVSEYQKKHGMPRYAQHHGK